MYISNSNTISLSLVNLRMTLNNPKNIMFNSFSGVLVAINTEFPNTNYLPSTTKQCDYNASLCANYGLPGHTCFNRQSKGVSCNASVDFPYISSLTSIACTNDQDYQLKDCPTVGANIILTGHYFNQSGSVAKSVKVGVFFVRTRPGQQPKSCATLRLELARIIK